MECMERPAVRCLPVITRPVIDCTSRQSARRYRSVRQRAKRLSLAAECLLSLVGCAVMASAETRAQVTCALSKARDPSTLAVFFFTPTLPGDVLARRLIRETWWSEMTAITSRSTFCESLYSPAQQDQRPVCVDARFMVGTSSEKLLPRIDHVKIEGSATVDYDVLAEEASRHGDLVFLQVVVLVMMHSQESC